jgi:hypothetical protein
MARFAILDPSANRIDRYIDIPDEHTVLPCRETSDEPGESQILGSAVVLVSESEVVIHRPAVRALSGLVAIVGDDGVTVEEVRDLGPDLCEVSDDVLPFEEVKPDFDPTTQVMLAAEDSREGDRIVRVHPVRKKTADELAADKAAAEEAKLTAALGTLGPAVLFDMESRVRAMTKQSPIDEAAYRAQLLEKIG